MTTPVMIRSWTGAMVRLRPTMVVRTYQGDLVVVDVNEYDNELSCMFNGHPFVFQPDECTLVHAPFVVGDEVEFFQDYEWHKSESPITEQDMNRFSDYPHHLEVYRHADENLRDSPDYKPEGEWV